MINLIYLNSVPHWEEDGVVLPIIAGGDATSKGSHASPLSPQHHTSLHANLDKGPLTAEALLNSPEFLELIDQMFGAQGSSGPAPPTFGETQAGFEFQAAEDRAARVAGEKHDKALLKIRDEMDAARDKANNAFARGERLEGQKWQETFLGLQQKFQAKEADKDRDFQKELRKEDLKAERQRIFVDMMGKDPVRATLFALGVGGSILPGGERFEDLPALAGAKQQEIKTESALTGLLRGTGAQDIDLSASGVTGLPPAIKSARSFQQAGASGKSVLTSAFGVGDIRAGKQPGINPQEFLELIDSVTPKGGLQ